MNQTKIEGYWYSTYTPEYPLPIPNVLTQEEAEKIYELILIKEKESVCMSYRGRSSSRITGEMLGCKEYNHTDGWKWPGDFAKHYVLDHKVRPTDEFLKWIGFIS